MLPILRIIPVGGVLLAFLILVLALTPPGTRPTPLTPSVISARGPLLDRNEHPEWRQVLFQAALRRAEELVRLRELPDTPVRHDPAPEVIAPVVAAPPPVVSAPEPIIAPLEPIVAAPEQTPRVPAEEQKVVGLPQTRVDAEPDRDSITGSVDESSGATIPVDIGEASAFELPVVVMPVVMPQERPVIQTPAAKPAKQIQRKAPVRKTRAKPPRAKPARVSPARVTPQPTVQPGFFETLFSEKHNRPAANGGAQTSAANQRPQRAPQ